MKRTLLRLIILKLVGFCLVGTCWAQEWTVTHVQRACFLPDGVIFDRVADCGKTDAFAQAIARAEGFYQRGTIPARFHNPGDLKARPGEQYPGQVRIGKGGHVVFRNDAAGWAALYHQIDKALTGESKFYQQDMTLAQVAKRYAANSKLWAKNVAHNLGVTPSTTLQEFFELPPKVTYELRACNRAPMF